jgi:hypothetical protein
MTHSATAAAPVSKDARIPSDEEIVNTWGPRADACSNCIWVHVDGILTTWCWDGRAFWRTYEAAKAALDEWRIRGVDAKLRSEDAYYEYVRKAGSKRFLMSVFCQREPGHKGCHEADEKQMRDGEMEWENST